jgi:hypothetical protein
MNERDFGIRNRPQKRKAPRDSDDEIQYLLNAEEQLLQSISARSPLPQVLNRICGALDCQIGGVISLICLASDDARDAAAIGTNAALFGLCTFYAEPVVAENDELLGCLDMYSSVPRKPSAKELQLIERARCLAAIAIKLDKEAGPQGNLGMRRGEPVRGRAFEPPVPI